MIVLDTNVISAMVRQPVDEPVKAWLNRQERNRLWTTAINVYELEYGIRRLAAGRRQDELDQLITDLIRGRLRSQILNLDIAAAMASGLLAAQLSNAGNTIEARDAMIAGIVIANGASFATRNIRRFQYTGIPLVNPWDQTTI